MDNTLVLLFSLVLGVVFSLTIVNTILIVLLFQDKKNENVRLSNIELYLKELSEEVESQVGDDLPATPMFHSVDGKYHGRSLPELLQQMMKDPNNNIPKDIDPTDPEIIKQFLKDINSEPEYDEEDDDEEDSADDWKKK